MPTNWIAENQPGMGQRLARESLSPRFSRNRRAPEFLILDPPPSEAPSSHVFLRIDELAIRRAANQHGPRGNIVTICLRTMFQEAIVRRIKQIQFRSRDNAEIRAAYCAMQTDDFAVINARQAWANWRTIPRNLSGRLPAAPVSVIDLCCGTGESSAVLAYYCAPGTSILGLEFNPRFVELARSRYYYDCHQGRADVRFHAQNVLETFRDSDRTPIPSASIDLVNASGAIGCHFDLQATAMLAQECARVIRPGGLAMIDVDRDAASVRCVSAIFAGQRFDLVNHARSCVFDRFRQLCLKKRAHSPKGGVDCR